MSYTSFLSDPIATRDRGEWLAEFYIKDSLGAQVLLRFSYRGTSTALSAITIGADSIPAHTKYPKRLIVLPTVTQSLWQSGKILSSSFPTFGSIKLTNQDGGLDQYSPSNGYQWSGCRCKIFFCDYLNVQSTIGKSFDGYIGSPDFSIPEINIPLKGQEDLFEVSLSDRVFRGTSYALELDNKVVTFPNNAALSLNTDLTLEGWLWFESLPTPSFNANLWGWNVLAAPFRVPFLFSVSYLGQLKIFSTINGIFETSTSTNTLSTLGFYHVAIVISGRTVIYHIYNDSTQVTLTETYTNFFSNATRDPYNTGGANEFILKTQNGAKPWYDEMRIYNYARTIAEIEADRFRPLSTIPSTCKQRLACDENGGSSVIDSSAVGLTGTISGAGTATWLWVHEGGPELAGTAKPDVYGERWGVLPTLVDGVRQGYCVAGGGPINDITSYEGGLSHTMVASSANFRTYITTTPAAGTSLRYLPRGLFKLGSQPTLPISALVKGYSGGSLGYVNKGDTITRDVITRRGPKIVDPTGIDTASFTAYATANPAIIGEFIQQPNQVTIRSFLDKVMVTGAGWWGYIKASLLFHIEKFAGPGLVANYNFTERSTISITPLPPNAVIYKVIVRFRQNNVKLSEDQVAATVKSTANWQQWTQEWQVQERSDQSIRDAYPGNASVAVTFDTLLQYQTDAGLLADYLLALLKGRKLGWSVTVNHKGLEVNIGHTTTQRVILQKGSSPRLGLDGVSKYSVLTTIDNPQEGTVKLEYWGG